MKTLKFNSKKEFAQAIIEATPIFNSYVHECTNCKHIILESEWKKVKEQI